MKNKEERKINGFLNISLRVLVSVAIYFTLALHSNTSADLVTDDCLNFKIETHNFYKMVHSSYYEVLQYYHVDICKEVEEGRLDRTRANEVMNNIIVRCALCRRNDINPIYKFFYEKELKMPDSVELAFQQFCRDTYDPNEYGGFRVNGLRERLDWLTAEYFCQFTRDTVNPSGWISIFKPDLPSLKKLEERTDLLCEDLRNGKITPPDAWYRWQQEVLVAQKNIRPEQVKDFMENLEKLKGPVEFILKMFK